MFFLVQSKKKGHQKKTDQQEIKEVFSSKDANQIHIV